MSFLSLSSHLPTCLLNLHVYKVGLFLKWVAPLRHGTGLDAFECRDSVWWVEKDPVLEEKEA